MPKPDPFDAQLRKAHLAAKYYRVALRRKCDVGDPEAKFAAAVIVIWDELMRRAESSSATNGVPVDSQEVKR